MLFQTKTEFMPKKHTLPFLRDRSQTRLGHLPMIHYSNAELSVNDSLQDTLTTPVYMVDEQLQQISFSVPIGPNLNNPTVPSQFQKSPIAKRFELAPTTMIGLVDKRRNTISLAPPMQNKHYSKTMPKRRTVQKEEAPSFMITSPSLLNKTLHKHEVECPFVSNYHVPNRS